MGKVRFGLKNVHYAIYDSKTNKYGDWKDLPGDVKLTADPQGDTSKFYASDVAYYVTNTNSGESGSLEVAALTDDMLIDLLGYERDETSGLLFEPTDAQPNTVALGYEVDGNEEKQRGVRYNVTFSRPKQESNTKGDKSDPDTVSLDYTAIGRDFTVGGKVRNILKAHCDDSGETHAAYDKFFDKVLVPGVAPASA